MADSFSTLTAAVWQALVARRCPAALITPDLDSRTLYLPLGEGCWWACEVSAEDLAGDVGRSAVGIVADWMRAA